MATLEELQQQLAALQAKVNAITEPPDDYYTSRYSGEELDNIADNANKWAETDKLVRQLPGQNLLDNSVFIDGCLVDQRQGYVVPPGVECAGESSGFTTKYYIVKGTFIFNDVKYASFEVGESEYSVPFWKCVRGYTGAGYGPDRWLMWGNSNVCLITESGIVTLDTTGQTPWLSQKFPVNFLHPGVYTISALFVSKIKSDSPRINFYCDGIGDLASITDTDDSLIVGTFTIPESAKDKQMWASFDCSNCDGLKAAFLDLGDHQKHFYQDENGVWQLNEIPDYGEQLARCQRHCIEIVPAVSNDYGAIGSGSAVFTDRVYVCVPLPVTMRAQPTVSYTGNWKLVSGVAAADGFDVNWLAVDKISNNSVTLNVTTANQVLTVGKTYHLWRTPASKNSMLFSADL